MNEEQKLELEHERLAKKYAYDRINQANEYLKLIKSALLINGGAAIAGGSQDHVTVRGRRVRIGLPQRQRFGRMS